MTFKVSARTLLNLGAELISSDGVAFYELIKNGLDAGSRVVRLDVVIALSQPSYRALTENIPGRRKGRKPGTNGSAASGDSFEVVRATACEQIDTSAVTASDALARLRAASTWEQLSAALESILSELNYIAVSDTGSGMSLKDLSAIYLTIGTPSRLRERELWKEEVRSGDPSATGRRPVLGEKGVGRLSAMRLGDHMQLETSLAGETRWNVLDIDWSRFTDVNALIEDIPIEPQLGAAKGDAAVSGTTIRISKLSSFWSRAKLEKIVTSEFSKLVDPFRSGVRFPVRAFFNGQLVEIPRFNRVLFEHAHATVQADYATDPEPRISGRIWYVGNRRKEGDQREETFEVVGTHLVSLVGGLLPGEDVTVDTLQNLGPFKLTLYWYNRQRLSAIDGIGNRNAVRDLLADWAGGIMVFRDGFRVSPYGEPSDDWLDLDKRALAYRSFKVNRRQIIGKIDITAAGNSLLVDQTNREGLRDTVEKRVLVRLLKWVIEGPLLGFLNLVDSDKEKPSESVDLDELDARVRTHDAELDQLLARFSSEHPEIDREYRIVALIQENRQILRATMTEVRERAEEYETGRAQLVHLAGVGLMVEILAHELNRATAHTLDTLTDAERLDVPTHLARVLSTLESQLRSLQRRLRTLDPLSTRGRQVKESFDLVTWVQETLEAHRAQFQRHGIRLRFRTEPERETPFMVRAVKGMIVQVLENLISNSVYWLRQERRLRPTFQPEIEVVVDTGTKQLRFSDNGPGIEPARRELVFRAFHSTKPPGAGSGLGLFIAREIAEYHDASLYLDPTPSGPRETLHTFVFDLQPVQPEAAGDIK